MVIDLDTGDRLALNPPHRESPGQYDFSNVQSGNIANGGYYTWSGPDLTVFEVRALNLSGQARWYLARSEFDISRIADLFRASLDTSVQNHRTTVLVVDARPETPIDIDRRTGMRSDSQ